MASAYVIGLQTELANLQAQIIAESGSVAGSKPDTSDGSRSEGFNALSKRITDRMEEINNILARIQPGYLPMPVRGL